jgi:hypothetical protein
MAQLRIRRFNLDGSKLDVGPRLKRSGTDVHSVNDRMPCDTCKVPS